MNNREKMRPISIIFAAAFFALGTIVAWLIAATTIDWIEASQEAELEQAYYAADIGWAEVEADGFLLTIRGETDSGHDRERAYKIATLIFGDKVTDETSAPADNARVAAAEPPAMEILKNGNDFSFLGTMPTGETTDVFARYVAALDGDMSVTNVTSPIGAAPENWLPAFEFALQLTSLVDQAILNVKPGEVALVAVANSANWQLGFEEMAEKMRPDNVVLTVDISSPRPVISPYSFVFDVAEPDAAVCAVQDEVEAARIFTKAEQVIGARINCDIGLGAPSRQWREAIEAGLDALADFGGGRLEIRDADVSLTAPEGTGQQDFDRIAKALRLGLPDGFSLVVNSAEAPAPPEIEEALPMAFTATLGADGNAVIDGAVKDTLTREVVMRFSEAKFGFGRVQDQMWLDETLPDGWQARVFKLIDALALLNSGTAAMRPTGLEISGDAAFENPEAELGKLLEDTYSADETSLEISYTEALNSEDGQGLDPRLCVSRVTKLLAENSIVFAPSSAVISDPSLPAIEAIAAILTQCRDARIEIGGHTDSQGRDEMNLALSQGRADAVLDALLAQNLLLGDISAKGYGEAEPIADNGTDEGRAKNRRIEFKLLRDAPADAAAPAPAETTRVVIENFTRPAMRAPAATQESAGNE